MLAEMNMPPSNPSSAHEYGREAKKRLYNYRSTIANYFNVKPADIIFTSGGTESMSLLIQGLAKPGRIITTDGEHSALYQTIRAISNQIDVVPLTPTPQQIAEAITPETSMIILSAVNSETGEMIDLNAIGQLAEQHNLVFIVDGVALIGKAPITLPKGVSGIGFSAHKFHGPKGVGFCIVDPFANLTPTLRGGPQEMMRRAGTENLIGIAGMAAAIQTLSPFPDLAHLRDTFEKKLLEALPNAKINARTNRISNVSNIYFEGVDAETLLILLDSKGLFVSLGSACSSGALEPSRALLAMGYSKVRALQSIRFSFSRYNTLDEVNEAVAVLTETCLAYV